jgi:hypothetical protein
VSGRVLKREGTLVVGNNERCVVKWTEKGYRHRTYYYLVFIYGKKYVNPYRLKPYEVDYHIDNINNLKKWRGNIKW